MCSWVATPNPRGGLQGLSGSATRSATAVGSQSAEGPAHENADSWVGVCGCSVAAAGVLSRPLSESGPLENGLTMRFDASRRDSARNRQAGGHWFEPSTTHLESPRRRGFSFSRRETQPGACSQDVRSGRLSSLPAPSADENEREEPDQKLNTGEPHPQRGQEDCGEGGPLPPRRRRLWDSTPSQPLLFASRRQRLRLIARNAESLSSGGQVVVEVVPPQRWRGPVRARPDPG